MGLLRIGDFDLLGYCFLMHTHALLYYLASIGTRHVLYSKNLGLIGPRVQNGA